MRKILIVEDNYMIADQVEECLEHNGYEVCGIASTVTDAVSLYREHQPDLLIVDIRLEQGELGTGIAAQIAPFGKLGILYVTGNGNEVFLSDADGHACLGKPYVTADLLRSLQLVFDLIEDGRAAPPFPSGFRLLKSAASTETAMRS
jgi:DNA-binding response OmpR family regulator